MEEWVRISYLLPITTGNDRTAYLRVLNYLRSRYPRAEPGALESPIAGFTYTSAEPPAFQGLYWSARRGDWVPDTLVLLIVDRPGSIRESGPVLDDARSIKARIAEFYAEEASPQDEIWCTLQQIYLL